MNAERELLDTYRDWHRLAIAEAKAIRTHDWNLLADCQLVIADFQALTGRLLAETRREWEQAGLDVTEKERHLKVYIHQLLEITRENQTLLQAAKAVATAKLAELGGAGRNIKRLRSSYGNVGGLLYAT